MVNAYSGSGRPAGEGSHARSVRTNGDPFDRDAALVAADVRNGVVSRESAAADYGVVLTEDGSIDEAATAAARKRG